MTLATKLRHRINVQSRTASQDANTGETVFVWANLLAGEPAEVVPLSGREFIQSGATQAGVDTRMTIRWRSGIEPTMRVVFDGHNYQITAVLPDPTNRRWLTLMCQRGVSDGV